MSKQDAIAWTGRREEGWYPGNRPQDPNPTLNGVIQTTYDWYRDKVGRPRQSVRLMTPQEQGEIYASFWSRAHCDEVLKAQGRAAAAIHFDTAFNAGGAQAIKILQKCLGVFADGIWGPTTFKALSLQSSDLPERLLWARLRYYEEISRARPNLRPNLLEWLDRTLDLRDHFVLGGA